MGRITIESLAPEGRPERDGWEEFAKPIAVMGRVIYALVLREARTRYGESRLGYLWALVDPVVVTAIFILIYHALGRQPPIAASLQVFLLTGYIPFMLFRNCVQRAAASATSNSNLLTYPQVKVSDIVISRVILEVCTTTVVYPLIIMSFLVIFGEPVSSWYDDGLGMLSAYLAMFYFILCGAVFSSSISRVWAMWPNIWSYAARPLFILSGIIFTLETVPLGVREYLSINPIAHMIEWFRSVSIPGFESEQYSPFYVIACATVGLAIGLVIDRYLMLTGDEDLVG